jgi:intracellular multiplication protein IcmL
MPLKDAVATILNRNSFYRDGYRLLLRITIIQGIVIAIMVAAIATLVLTVQTRQIYFATTSDGRIINIVPLNEPYRSPAEVIAWAASTSQNIMRFGYNDYRDRLQQASSSFTPTGWDSFSRALKQANIIEALEARKLVTTMSIDGAPEITNAAVRNGAYNWDLKIPVTIHYDGNEPPQPSKFNLLLRIVRVSTLQNPDGISIEQWVPSYGNGK